MSTTLLHSMSIPVCLTPGLLLFWALPNLVRSREPTMSGYGRPDGQGFEGLLQPANYRYTKKQHLYRFQSFYFGTKKSTNRIGSIKNFIAYVRILLLFFQTVILLSVFFVAQGRFFATRIITWRHY